MPRPALRDSTIFNLNLFKGKVAQVTLETVFLEFGYFVYPFGYESYFTNLIKSLSGRTEVQATKLRSMPDLVAMDPQTARAHILEIKATNAAAEDYLFSQRQAEFYSRHWPEADLVVFCVPRRDFFVAAIADLPFDHCQRATFGNGQEAYHLPLDEHFTWLPNRFDFDTEEYSRIMNQMWWQLGRFIAAGRR